MEVQTFVKSALLGGVVGGLAVLLLTPKSGKAIRDDLVTGYDNVNQHTHELADLIINQGQKLYNTLRGVEESHSHNSLLLGGALGAVIGATAALLLAPQSGDRLRHQLGEKYDEVCQCAESALYNLNKTKNNLEHKVEDWKEVFSTLIDKLAPAKGQRRHAVHDIADWADLGLRLYAQLQKGR